MFFRSNKKNFLLMNVFFILSFFSIISFAGESKNNSENILQATPEKCVTVREGRNCKAEVLMKWKTDKKQSLCLKQAGQDDTFICWENKNEGEYTLKFNQSKSTEYVLIDMKNEKIVSQAWVEVAWVYKQKRNNRRWQMF